MGLEDLAELRGPVEGRRPAPHAVAEQRDVDRVRVVRVELTRFTPPLEPILPSGRGIRVRVAGEDQVERGASVGGLVETERGSVRRGPPAAVGRRGAVAGDRRAPVVVVRVGRVDRDRSDRAILGDRHAGRDQGPRAAVRRGEEADAGLGVTRAVGLTGSREDPVRVVRVNREGTDRVRRDPVVEGRPRGRGGEPVRREPDAAARGADPDLAVPGDARRGGSPSRSRARSSASRGRCTSRSRERSA